MPLESVDWTGRAVSASSREDTALTRQNLGEAGSEPLAPATAADHPAAAGVTLALQVLEDMKAEDMQAMFAYLKSTKPVENVVPAPVPPAGCGNARSSGVSGSPPAR